MLNLFSHSPLLASCQASLMLIFRVIMLLNARRSRPNLQWHPEYRQLLTKAYDDSAYAKAKKP